MAILTSADREGVLKAETMKCSQPSNRGGTAYRICDLISGMDRVPHGMVEPVVTLLLLKEAGFK